MSEHGHAQIKVVNETRKNIICIINYKLSKITLLKLGDCNKGLL